MSIKRQLSTSYIVHRTSYINVYRFTLFIIIYYYILLFIIIVYEMSSGKKTVKRKRCPNGTLRNKKTGNCDPKKNKKAIKMKKLGPPPKPSVLIKNNTVKRKRCPNGTLRNKKTGNCESKNKVKQISKNTVKKNNMLQTPTHDKSLASYMRSQIKKMSDMVVPYSCYNTIRKFMLLHLIKNNKNTCLYNILKYPELRATYTNIIYNDSYVRTIKEHYNLCKNKMKLFALPFIIAKGRHANMIIFNPYRNEAERFEPHGANTRIDGFNHTSITNQLRKFVKLIDPMLTFIPSHKTCPIGFKAYQQFDTNKPVRQKIDGTYIKDAGGYCCAWSFFYADLRMKYPKYSGSKIIKTSIDIIGKNPNVYRHFIRGQVTYLKKIINVKPGYPFEKYVMLTQLTKQSNYINNQIAEYEDIYETHYKDEVQRLLNN
jgi:hypothetical protein